MDKICIIVPVYNVERYVKKCIASILAQSYTNIEVIIVNDGSTDNSLGLCIECSKQDKRVRVVSKKNGGLSDARNYGMQFCTCELITFIDSDDFVSRDYIKNLYELMQKYQADIACTNYIRFYDNCDVTAVNKKIFEKVFDSQGAIKDVLYQKNIANSAWGKIYKFSLFEDIIFPKGRLCEDLGTFYKLFRKASIIVYSSIQDYYYLQRKTSIMGSEFTENKLDSLYFANEIYNEFLKTKIKKSAEARICAECVSLLKQIPKDNKKMRRRIIAELRSHAIRVLLNHRVKLVLKIKILLNLYG
jgi:glycosyltransferases involved in cell wall biogenesis